MVTQSALAILVRCFSLARCQFVFPCVETHTPFTRMHSFEGVCLTSNGGAFNCRAPINIALYCILLRWIVLERYSLVASQIAGRRLMRPVWALLDIDVNSLHCFVSVFLLFLFYFLLTNMVFTCRHCVFSLPWLKQGQRCHKRKAI